MKGMIKKSRLFVVAVLVAALMLTCTNAFAKEGRDKSGKEAAWIGAGIFSVLALGIIANSLSSEHTTVAVRSAPNNYRDHVYYSAYQTRYVVVPEPAVYPVASVPVVVPAQGPSWNTAAVNVPNYDGTYTTVILQRNGNGYTGPQGEYYPGNPSLEQLRALYGR